MASKSPVYLTDSICIIPARLAPRIDTFMAYRDQQLQGMMLVRTYEENGDWVIEEHIIINHAHISERTISRLTSNSFVQKSLNISGSQGDNPIDIQLEWDHVLVKGTSTYPREQQSRTVNVFDSLPAGMLERTALLYLLPAMELSSFTEKPISWYNAQQGIAISGRILTTGMDTISIAAGTFEVQIVDMLGDSPGQRVYISRNPPYRILKLEALDVPWVFELK